MGPKMTKGEMVHAKAMRQALRDIRSSSDPEVRAKAKERLNAARSGLASFWARQKKIDQGESR
jgi:hypothetical protein